MKNNTHLYVLFILFATQSLIAQEKTSESYSVADTLQDFGLFAEDDLLEITLSFDITTFRRKKSTDEYLDGKLTYYVSKTDSITRKVRLVSRGEFRNKYCNFPPILLNFKKKDSIKNDLSSLDKVKLVTHCESGNEMNLLKEYLIYKLYNAITDSSFRVRLARINYVNSVKPGKPIRAFAFFIEPDEFLAKRMNAIPIDLPRLNQTFIVPTMIDRVALFNYMVGNADWGITNQHNVRLFIENSNVRSNLSMIVPYDFDYTGFVNANYAIPDQSSQIKSVRERIYTGLCRSDEVFLKALNEFAVKKDQLFSIIADFHWIDDRTRKDLIQYLNEFYKGFDKKNSIISELKRTCREH